MVVVYVVYSMVPGYRRASWSIIMCMVCSLIPRLPPQQEGRAWGVQRKARNTEAAFISHLTQKRTCPSQPCLQCRRVCWSSDLLHRTCYLQRGGSFQQLLQRGRTRKAIPKSSLFRCYSNHHRSSNAISYQPEEQPASSCGAQGASWKEPAQQRGISQVSARNTSREIPHQQYTHAGAGLCKAKCHDKVHQPGGRKTHQKHSHSSGCQS